MQNRYDIAKQYGVKKVALFGSYSTGEEIQDSDVDLLIDKGEIIVEKFIQ